MAKRGRVETGLGFSNKRAHGQISPRTGSNSYCYAMVCASNVNRSTEAHDRLHEAGLSVESFGAGTRVRLPGPHRDDPREYEFGTPYEKMYMDLKLENEELFRRNGVLTMLERDMKTKRAPQRWQEQNYTALSQINVVICFEDRIWDAVIDDLQSREWESFQYIHVLCLDIKDTHEGAKGGGNLALLLCHEIENTPKLDENLPIIISTFEETHKLRILYAAQLL